MRRTTLALFTILFVLSISIAYSVQEKINIIEVPSEIGAGTRGESLGVKMAMPQERIGVLWIDAHADIHTPYTTPSGNIHGMPVATAIAEDNLYQKETKWVRSPLKFSTASLLK